MNETVDLAEVAEGFALQGAYGAAVPYGSGHINDTFAVTYSQAGARLRYIFQRINERIFTDPAGLMENIRRVTEAAQAVLKVTPGITDPSRRALRVIPGQDGRAFHLDAQGKYWRCYPFIEGARTYDVIENSRQAYEAAKAFGEFQRLVSGLEGPRLNETIPHFHHTRSRFEKLRTAVTEDAMGRLAEVAAEWAFAQQREPMVDVLLDLAARGEIPERITHNDTKLNNVMIDDTTGTGICVIDLDTVMPGLALYDFGDLVRTATSPAAEDERDLSLVRMQMPMFEALARGYLESAGSFLTETERAYLPFSGKLIAFEIGLRFLTDYLQGDVYFKTKRPGHNLDRARTQFALVQSIEAQETAMKSFVTSLKINS